MILNKKKQFHLLFFCICVVLALFFLTFKYLHIEKDLKPNNDCPICRFEKTASLFYAISCTLLSLISLYIILSRIYLKEAQWKLSYFSHILGQRAPPLAK